MPKQLVPLLFCASAAHLQLLGIWQIRDLLVTVRDDVSAFIARLSPEPVCDDCIADRLQLSVRQHANHKTRELAGQAGFERRRDSCSLCGSEKLVIRKTASSRDRA